METRTLVIIVGILIGVMMFLAFYNDIHVGVDIFHLGIIGLILALLAFFLWWYKLKDGALRLRWATGCTTVASRDPWTVITARIKDGKVLCPELYIWKKEGFDRPKYWFHPPGGGRHGVLVFPSKYINYLGAQVDARVWEVKRFQDEEEKFAFSGDWNHIEEHIKTKYSEENIVYNPKWPVFMGLKPMAPEDAQKEPEADTDQEYTNLHLRTELGKAEKLAEFWRGQATLKRSWGERDSGMTGRRMDPSRYDSGAYGGHNGPEQR